MLTIEVEMRVIGRRTAAVEPHPVGLEMEPGSARVRDLIAAVVRSEVAASRERSVDRAVLRVLTEGAMSDGVAVGKIISGELEPADHVDEATAIDTAILAHEDGLYQVVIDDEPLASLDDVIQVSSEMTVMFIRLVALTGG